MADISSPVASSNAFLPITHIRRHLAGFCGPFARSLQYGGMRCHFLESHVCLFGSTV